jgi:hypothetical protein
MADTQVIAQNASTLAIDATNLQLRSDSVKDSIIQVGNASIHRSVYDAYKQMQLQLISDKDIELQIIESFTSKYQLVDELRKLVKQKNKYPEYKLFLDDSVSIETIARNPNFLNFTIFLDNLPGDEFEPPITNATLSNTQTIQLYQTPNKLNLDPRRSAIYVKFGPTNTIHDSTLRWLNQYAFDYGFIFYGPYDKSVWMYNKKLTTGATIFPTKDALSSLLNYLD